MIRLQNAFEFYVAHGERSVPVLDVCALHALKLCADLIVANNACVHKALLKHTQLITESLQILKNMLLYAGQKKFRSQEDSDA